MPSVEGRLVAGAAAAAALALACGGESGGGGLPDTSRNVVPISADGALCGGNPGTYLNEPCVRVTVCSPGTQTCQTVDDVLLDTGSFGLRVFQQVLTVPLASVSAGSGELGECMHFGDLSADWGPVRLAGVILGGEPAVQVPIHVIDASFPGRPASCSNPDTDPASAGFNGILGVGAFAEDCGGACASSANTGIYYACSGGSCSGTAVPLSQQVKNPVAALPQDNNGVVVKLPAVAAGGAPSADGALLLGIGTAQDNAPGSVSVLDLDGSGEFRTSLAGTAFPSFADTGSNALFFDAPGGVSLPVCASSSEWFCPPSATSLSATNSGASGHGSASVGFQVVSFDQLSKSGNAVFPTLAGPGLGSGEFDWGLPFFLGRTVYVGLEGKASPLGAGPYVAH
jgi:Protein of unknown function (DUF3443)